jgi:hypothetical protein
MTPQPNYPSVCPEPVEGQLTRPLDHPCSAPTQKPVPNRQRLRLPFSPLTNPSTGVQSSAPPTGSENTRSTLAAPDDGAGYSRQTCQIDAARCGLPDFRCGRHNISHRRTAACRCERPFLDDSVNGLILKGQGRCPSTSSGQTGRGGTAKPIYPLALSPK